MAGNYEVAKAVVTIIPSMQGSQAAITKELDGASAAAGKSAGKTMGSNMSSSLTSSMGSVGKTIAGVTASVVGGAVAVGAALMESFKEVDAGLDTIQTKTGASGQALEDMRDSMENLATSIPTSFEEAGSAIGEVNTRFKVTGQELENLSGKFVKFAQLNEVDVSSAVDSVSKVIAAFGMDSSEAGTMLDALNKVGQDTGVGMDKLTSALSQNAAQLTEMGLSAYDAAGFLGSCDMAGMEISTTMMGLKTAMKNAASDGKTLDTFLSEFTDTMNSNASESDKLAAAYETFGTRAGGAIYNAVQNGKINLEDLSNSLGDFEGSVDSTFEAVTDPTDRFGQVMNRLKIIGADLAESAMPLVESALEGVAGALEFVMDALTPTETALTRFIDNTHNAIDANQAAIEKTESAVTDVTSSIGEIEIYKDTLLELLDKSEKTELEQFMLKDAVDQLSASVPGLKDAYDEVNGTFNITNEEIIEMIDNAEALALKTAMIEAQKETYKNYADAIVNAAKASQGLTRATEDFNNAEEYTYSGIEGLMAIGGEASKSLSDQGRAMRDANAAYVEAGQALEQAKNDMQDMPEAIKAVADEYGIDLTTAADTATDSLNEAGDAATEASEEIATASQLSDEELAEMEKAAKEVEQAFLDFREGVQKSMLDSLSFMDEFNGGTELTADQILANLRSTGEGVENWAANMAILGEQAGSGMSQGLYDELLEMGPGAANIVQELVNTLQSDAPKFKEISDQYAANLDLTTQSDNLARFSSAGKKAAEETTKGIQNASGGVKSAAETMSKEATAGADAQMQSGIKNMENNALMGMNGVNNAVLIQLETMKSNFASAMGVIEGNVNGMIGNVRAALSTTLYGPNIKVPHFTMRGSFDAKTNSVPVVDVAWYEKGGIFTKPTIFGTPYGLKGVGEAGAEAVLPIELLKNYISDAMNQTQTVINVDMTVDGAESPEAWATDFVRSLRQQVRIG